MNSANKTVCTARPTMFNECFLHGAYDGENCPQCPQEISPEAESQETDRMNGYASSTGTSPSDPQEFITCPLCIGLGSVKQWEIDARDEEVERLKLESQAFSDEADFQLRKRDEADAEIKRLRNLLLGYRMTCDGQNPKLDNEADVALKVTDGQK